MPLEIFRFFIQPVQEQNIAGKTGYSARTDNLVCCVGRIITIAGKSLSEARAAQRRAYDRDKYWHSKPRATRNIMGVMGNQPLLGH